LRDGSGVHGAAGAATLIRRYGSLEALLKAGRSAKQAAELRLYKPIATMDRKAPLPILPDQTPTWAKAAALARAWHLNALAGRPRPSCLRRQSAECFVAETANKAVTGSRC
jgi:hypothetical protein